MEPSGPASSPAEHADQVGWAAPPDDFVHVMRTLLSPAPVPQVLERIVRFAVDVVPGCDDAGLCGVDPLPGAPPEAEPLAELDLLQRSTGEGPCLDALAGADVVHSADVWNDGRWPALGGCAADQHARSAISVRLFSGEQTLGVLHLYAGAPGAFSALARAQALLFGAHAGLALSAARSHAADELRVEQFRAAMLTRELIGQAQGILMERERVTAHQAFALIRAASQHLNVKLRDVAQELVDTGHLSADPEPRPGPDAAL